MRLEKLESALELELLGKRRADVDKTSAETISCLISAVEDVEEAIVRVGSVIVIKRNGKVYAEKVDERVARKLEADPTILTKPDELALFFEAGRQHEKALDSVDEHERKTSKQGGANPRASDP